METAVRLEDALYDICQNHLPDLEMIAQAYRNWLNQHPERLDEGL